MTETSRPHRIRFDRVELSRGGRKLFDGLDLTLSERRVGLIGDNGSGKSSLLRLINGLILPDSGEVWFGARDTRRHRRELPGDIGFVFQNPDHQIIFPTVGEEVAFAFGNGGLKGRAAEAEAARCLAEHGCPGWESRAVHELSGGERQRVAIISVLAARPSLLLLDEPFASLDLPMRMAFRRLIRELPLQIVMASHDLELLADCDRVVWLERGRIVDDGSPDRILPAYHEAAARRVMAP
ncbi:MAG: ABC transporter ATP-binding protein [Chelatococcus sp.]|uniref:energy-coupling factor ABC transporter ATP-binding protein n=1 Tax=Chelatococcus sp. TaxID=1953771 RepID=UPI0025BC02EF|nr:ABC transporter ATP-binding protein [Chelatococcus sp.]MBX3537065.1 ABC transporter ATP-binding protein [Chelatococcus sp.]